MLQNPLAGTAHCHAEGNLASSLAGTEPKGAEDAQEDIEQEESNDGIRGVQIVHRALFDVEGFFHVGIRLDMLQIEDAPVEDPLHVGPETFGKARHMVGVYTDDHVLIDLSRDTDGNFASLA